MTHVFTQLFSYEKDFTHVNFLNGVHLVCGFFFIYWLLTQKQMDLYLSQVN